MQKKKLSGKALVIQLTARELRVARMTLGTAMPQIVKSAVVPLPEGTMEDGMIRQPAVLQTLLGNVTADPEFSRVQQAVFTLCTSQVITETVSVPQVPDKKMDQLLSANMDLYFPVSPQDYRMVWQIVGPGKENGEVEVQLWAAPRAVLEPYYTVANACGLTVAAINYCGDSLAAAAGISYAGESSAAKRGKAQLPAPQQPSANAPAGNAALYLTAESDQMLMTFAQDGRIRMQRVLLCSGSHDETMSEASMVMDYYLTMNPGTQVSELILSGGMVQDAAFVDAAMRNLGLPTRALPCKPGPEWCLCLGASRGSLDFGDPAWNRVKTVSQQLGVAWHYAFVLLGGALLAGAIVFLFTHKTDWNSTLNGLRSQEQTTQLQAAQTAAEAKRTEEEAEVYQGYAMNYAIYLNDYSRYSQDWDALFASLRTYNDNLNLALGELETILPGSTSVTQIYIADGGLYLQFACPDKEEAAYVFSQIRNMQYANLSMTSDLTVGPPTEWTSGLKPIVQTIPSAEEAAPETGSASELLDLLELAKTSDKLSDGLKAALSEVEVKYLATGKLDNSDLMTLYNSMDQEERDAFVDSYAELLPLPAGESLSSLKSQATLDQRKAAMKDMVSNDPAADYRLMKLVLNDYVQFYLGKDHTLPDDVYDDLKDNSDVLQALNGNVSKMQTAMAAIGEMLTKNEETLSATETLIQTDASMTRMYAHHLAAALGKLEALNLRDPDTLAALLRSYLGVAPPADDPTNPDGPTDPNPGGQDPEDPNPDDQELTDIQTRLRSWIMMNYNYLDADDLALLQMMLDDPDKIDMKVLQEIMAKVDEKKNPTPTPTPAPDDDLASLRQFYQQYYNFLDAQDRATLEDYLAHPEKIDQQVVYNIRRNAQENYNEWLKKQGGGGGGGGGGTAPVEPPDERIFFTVVLAYRPELIQSELARKGLSPDEKISPLEVPAE